MRYLKLALVGLAGGLLSGTAVLMVEVIHAQRVVASQIADCVDVAAGGVACAGSAQVGGVEVPIAFVLGFAAAVVWFGRRHQRPVA